MRPLGVVVGYRAEARCLVGPDLRVVCSGVDPDRARSAARRLCDEGASGLVSFGLAGALAADLTPGDLLLPEAVILPEGGSIATEPAWRGRLAATLERAGVGVQSAPILGSEHLVATQAAKEALRAQSGAVAVDMESHAVAAIAAQVRLPFLVLRAIADGQQQPIPSSAHGAIDAQGEVRPFAVLARLLGRPWEIASLVALGRGSRRGLASLRRVAALAPDLGFV